MNNVLITLAAVVMVGCGTQSTIETNSSLDALYSESSIGSLAFGVDGKNVYLVEGTKALSWAHEAPTLEGTKINFKGKQIGDVSSGYFCNGPFDAICDASLYKSRASTITMKALGNPDRSPKDPANLKIINADTKNLAGFQIATPVNGIAKGSCKVASASGAKTLPITVEQKKVLDANNKEVKMLEVKTPIYKYNANTKTLDFVQMKTLQKVFATGAVQNVQGATQAKSTEVQGLLRLFQ